MRRRHHHRAKERPELPSEADSKSAAGGTARAVSRPRGARPGWRFRVLTIAGVRRAFSLEISFWEVLEQMARARNLRVSQVVESILSEPTTSNDSSSLRLGALNWLRDQHKSLAGRDIVRGAQVTVDCIPVPALVLSDSKEIIAFNQLWRQFGVDGEASSVPLAQLRLGAPLERVVGVMKEAPKRVIALDVVVQLGTRTWRATAAAALFDVIGETSYVLCTLRGVAQGR